VSLSLHVRHAGSGPPVILLHGLFGSGANLGGLSRALREHFSVYSLDLPSHGRSQWLQPLTMSTLTAAVEDGLDHAAYGCAHVVGHSLGGKVAMELALSRPGQVASLTVADIAPVAYSARHDAVFAALEAVAQARCVSRESAASLMREYLVEETVVQFLLTSLVRTGDSVMAWRFDWRGISDAYSSFLAAPVGGRSYEGPVQFIRGAESDYIRKEHHPAIDVLFPRASLQVIPGAGHWLHAEQASAFNELVLRFLQSVQGEGNGNRNRNGEGAC
jgi:esterase